MFKRLSQPGQPRDRLSRIESVLFAIAVLIPATPTLIYLFTIDPFKFWVGQLFTCVLILSCPLFVGFSPTAVLLALSPFAAITPFFCAYAIATGYPPSVLSFQILKEATSEELFVFLPIILICTGLGFATLIGYWYLARRLNGITPILNTHLRWIGLLLLAFFLGKDIAAYGLKDGGPILLSRLEKIHPISPFVLFPRFLSEDQIIQKRDEILQKYSVTLNKAQDCAELCILVIGESSRKSAWGLYNDKSPQTTPLLKEQNLILYTNATACGTATIQSVPILLTGAFPSHGEILPFGNLGLVEAFRLAGFHTAWLSTQNADGNITSFITPFSNNAHERYFFNGRLEHSHFKNPEVQNDAIMLKPLAGIIDKSKGRLFVVLHTLGSHMPYSKRYPATHEKWPLSDEAKQSMWRWMPPFDSRQREQIDRAYLNSVHFTDWFLDQVIKIAKDSKRCASVVFVGDHGENDSGSHIMPAGHASLTSDVIKIPLFFWLSQEFETRHATAAETLRQNRDKKVSAQNIFSTLCGLHGIETASANKTQDLSCPFFREHDRLVYLLDARIVNVSATIPSADN